MKRLSPAKRNQLIGVIAATLALMGLVYFALINPQNEKNRALAVEIGKQAAQLDQYTATIKKMDETTAALKALNLQLQRAEQDVAVGDLYEWSVETMRNFKAGYHSVDVPSVGQPALSDCDLIGGFPYRQIRFSLMGTAYYHDLGKFISDFENKFPHCRVLNLVAAPMEGGGEKLSFRMDIVALMKPNN